MGGFSQVVTDTDEVTRFLVVQFNRGLVSIRHKVPLKNALGFCCAETDLFAADND
jgi:hypothetical protein